MKNSNIPPCESCTNDNKMFCMLSSLEKEGVGLDKGHNFYKKGQSIFYEGNHSNGLYCIYKGKVKLSKLGEKGKEHVLRFAKAGEILGYRSLFGQDTFQSTATALEDSQICLLSTENFLNAIKGNHEMALTAMKLLSDNLKRAESNLVNFAHKPVLDRIAYSLLFLQETFGLIKGTNVLDVKLTRTEIADIAGTTTESAIRSLAELHKKGVIKIEGKNIIILSKDKLVNVAHFNG